MNEIVQEGLGFAINGIMSRVKPKIDVKVPGVEVLEEAYERIYGKNGGEAKEVQNTLPETEQAPSEASQDISKGTACIPCGLSHVAACAGELNEAVRFARDDMANPEIVTRVNHCLSEITACERIDLAPENIVSLSPKEKVIADNLGKEIREIRHGLEWYASKEDLEQLAARTADLQHTTGQQWVEVRLANLSPAERDKIKAKVQEIMDRELEGGKQ